MHRIALSALLTLSLVTGGTVARASVSSQLQGSIRANTFEVVMKKPGVDTATYEKPLPLELLPFRERNDGYRSVGTAFALGNNTYVTAAHVFAAAIDSQYGAPELRGSDAAVYAVDRILRYSQHEDYVVFSLVRDPAPAGFAVNREPHLDDPVLAVGNALGEGIVIRDGLYTSATDEDQDGKWKWIRFSAAASPGNSGGPLLDTDGRVVGIVIGKSPNENLNYSLPIAHALDGDNHRAQFDQRGLSSLPYLHGTRIFSFQDSFALPLAWPAFAAAYQTLVQRHLDDARSELLKAYADTLFPQGPGSDTLLYAPEANGFEPFLINQQDDGAWKAATPSYSTTALADDGSVSVASESGATLLRLIRPGGASDDSLYGDSKAFMDLALRALNLRRPVGQDHVRITSLGNAKSDAVFADPYGRKWQERVWSVPFLDLYVVAELLPTPDGYAALLDYIPSAFLREGQTRIRLLTGQFGVSYRGSLTQWQAHLRRRTWLPDALAETKITRSPEWTIQSARLVFRPPAAAIALTDKSILTITMGFARSGTHAAWEIEDIWWARDDRMDVSAGLWRRTRPAAGARLELRNQFASMRERRAPYDGEMIRDSAETFAATRILEVPGKAVGTISADLLYGLTIRLVGHPTPQDAYRWLQDAIESTRLLERGFGDDMAGATSVDASNARDAHAPHDTPNTRSAGPDWVQNITSAMPGDIWTGKDLRGHLMSQDLRDFQAAYLAHAPRAQTGSAGAEAYDRQQHERYQALLEYWKIYPALTHNRDLWTAFLSRNHLPADTPHDRSVTDAETALLDSLAGNVPGPRWAEQAHTLLSAYIAERNQLSKKITLTPADYRTRVSPCPAPAAKTSGRPTAFYGNMTRSLEDFWPMESKRLGEEGTVRVTVRVTETGCAVAAAMITSSGSEMMDEAVMKFYETIEFLPGEIDGKAVLSVVTLPVVFKLRD